MQYRWLACVSSLLFVACGGSAPQAEAPEAEDDTVNAAHAAAMEEEPEDVGEADEPKPEAASAPKGVPDTCAPGKDDCVPDPAFVAKLCQDVHQDVALYMFRQGTPWQRLYLRGRTEAVNASGGASIEGFLEFDEEVIVLRSRKASKDGIQVGDSSGSYDAFRWNGSCVSLDGGEVTTDAPPKPKASRVEWRWMGETMRDAVRRKESVAEAFRARQKECKGATMGAVTKKCEQLDGKLVDEIVKYVRVTPDLPQPDEKF
jgi:hypothetical protein